MNIMPNWVKPIEKEIAFEEKCQKTLKKVLKKASKQWNKPLSLWKSFINNEEREILSKCH